MNILEGIGDLLIPISVCVILPISIVWLCLHNKKHETDKRTEVLLAAIESNMDIDVEELMQKMNPDREKSLKEKLLGKLLWGSIITALGVGLLCYSLWMDFIGGVLTRTLQEQYMVAIIVLLIGLAILLVFFVSKRMLEKELVAEEEKACTRKQ